MVFSCVGDETGLHAVNCSSSGGPPLYDGIVILMLLPTIARGPSPIYASLLRSLFDSRGQPSASKGEGVGLSL